KMEVPMGHDEIVKFYESLLKKEIDIKFRDWKEMTYIEDDGARPWHSINIYKGQGANTTIVINKDRWSWIIGTLILRFIGVFVVLIILMFALSFAGQVMKRLFKAEEKA
ncbi:MAG: OadG family protein, partial [candidate division WOR-3 bacterium]